MKMLIFYDDTRQLPGECLPQGKRGESRYPVMPANLPGREPGQESMWSTRQLQSWLHWEGA
ncbi:MAG: hypothetical protein QOJ58_4249, partial [Alphaproteobacteria bacterium]|nr:hypothetical protein [Alphaproteobacteria bacterium]